MCIPIFANSSRFIFQKRDNTIEYVVINKGVSNWLDFIYINMESQNHWACRIVRVW